MKKIMFNDAYGLTEAVLDGRKTQTRRVITVPDRYEVQVINTQYGTAYVLINRSGKVHGTIAGVPVYGYVKHLKPAYKVGEVVSVAQRYKDIAEYLPQDPIGLDTTSGTDIFSYNHFDRSKGWGNKMFVKAELMPHHIRITNIRVEKLQDISDEDCLAEGIRRTKFGDSISYYFERGKNFHSARGAYATLIDKVSGKGTWDSNAWVFVYDFVKED